MSACQVVAHCNARERRRVQAVNSAFSYLRNHVPYGPRNKRLSKVKTLQLAIKYIQQLQDMITTHDLEQEGGGACVYEEGETSNLGGACMYSQQFYCGYAYRRHDHHEVLQPSSYSTGTYDTTNNQDTPVIFESLDDDTI